MLSIKHFSTDNYFLFPQAFEFGNLSFVIMELYKSFYGEP